MRRFRGALAGLFPLCNEGRRSDRRLRYLPPCRSSRLANTKEGTALVRNRIPGREVICRRCPACTSLGLHHLRRTRRRTRRCVHRRSAPTQLREHPLPVDRAAGWLGRQRGFSPHARRRRHCRSQLRPLPALLARRDPGYPHRTAYRLPARLHAPHPLRHAQAESAQAIPLLFSLRTRHVLLPHHALPLPDIRGPRAAPLHTMGGDAWSRDAQVRLLRCPRQHRLPDHPPLPLAEPLP